MYASRIRDLEVPLPFSGAKAIPTQYQRLDDQPIAFFGEDPRRVSLLSLAEKFEGSGRTSSAELVATESNQAAFAEGGRSRRDGATHRKTCRRR